MVNADRISEFKKKTAIVILAYADYESLELALATHARFSAESGMDIYILQNGRGSYDCERTYAVAKRYHYLYPDTIFVVDDIKPGTPFVSLKQLFRSRRFERYEYIIKLDDDVMVLTDNWTDKLISCYLENIERYGDELAYVTSLVNNNPYGFSKIIENSQELAEEYYARIARRHYVGDDSPGNAYGPHRILPKERIYTGANGTIWRYPYIARWLHERTTLHPEQYIAFSERLGEAEVNNKERYSINCLLFRKDLWTDELSKVNPESVNDEHLLHAYCLKYNKKIIADLSIPMVHLFFFSQRDECRDMTDKLRKCYEEFLELPFPIALCANRSIEIENRLRFLEEKGITRKSMFDKQKKEADRLIKSIHERGFKLTIRKLLRSLRK